MTVETVLRRIERQFRVDAKAFAKYEPLVDGRKLCCPGPGARGEARGSVSTLEEIRTLCRTLRREHRLSNTGRQVRRDEEECHE